MLMVLEEDEHFIEDVKFFDYVVYNALEFSVAVLVPYVWILKHHIEDDDRRCIYILE